MSTLRQLILDADDIVVMTVVPPEQSESRIKAIDGDGNVHEHVTTYGPIALPMRRLQLADKRFSDDERKALTIARAAIERVADEEHETQATAERAAEKSALEARLAELSAAEPAKK